MIDYDKAIALDPQLDLAYKGKADTYQRLGVFDKAKEFYDKLAQLPKSNIGKDIYMEI